METGEKEAGKRCAFGVTSFFCGCGGLDLGFRGGFTYHGVDYPRTDFNLQMAYDFDERHVETYRRNVGTEVRKLDLSDFDVGEVPSARILIGGFPCQDFSTCGPRRGLASQRGRLYQAMIRFADAYDPEIIVGENVPGLENIDGGRILEKIREDVSHAGNRGGYGVEVWKLFAPDYGVPQNRTRLIIVGVRKDLLRFGFPEAPVKTLTPENYHTTRWAIEDLEEVVDESVPNQSQYFKASRARRGNGQGDETSPADLPSYTIRANAKSRVQFHYRLDRRLTVRECARIQTFPDSFVFPHSATTNIMEIGNAVPPILGNLVARSIQKFMRKIDDARSDS